MSEEKSDFESQEPKAYPLQRFTLEGIKTAVGVIENPSHKVLVAQFKESMVKANQDLTEGFTAWVEEDDLGHTAVYNADEKGTRFIARKTIIGGRPVVQSISGTYQIDGHEVSITVDQEENMDILNCRVFLNGSLMASRSNPFSWVQQQSEAFLRNKVEGEEEDASRLDTTITEERSPYPFAAKMLRDFSKSEPDKDMIQKMNEKMSSRSTVRWNKDYQLDKHPLFSRAIE